MASILESKNIKYDLFCLNYHKNVFKYILPNLPQPIGSANTYRYGDQELSLLTKLKIFSGAIFRYDVYSRLDKILEKKKYDYIIVLQYFLKISPSIFIAAKKHSIKVIFRQSDFGLICARNTFYRDGKVCTQCIKNQLNMVTNKCSGGLISSFLLYIIYKLNYLMIRYANPQIVWTNRNSFIIGSNAKALRRFEHRLNYTPVGIGEFDKVHLDKIYDYGYIGRLSVDKGVDTLLKQLFEIPRLNFNFIFVGAIDVELIKLVNLVKVKHGKHIIFIDKVTKKHVRGYLDSCRYLVFMSNWFDNLPNSLIEAYSHGIPCILPDFGCFSEFIPSRFPRLGYRKGSNLPLDEIISIGNAEYMQMSDSVKSISDKKFSNNQHLKMMFNEKTIY